MTYRIEKTKLSDGSHAYNLICTREGVEVELILYCTSWGGACRAKKALRETIVDWAMY